VLQFELASTLNAGNIENEVTSKKLETIALRKLIPAVSKNIDILGKAGISSACSFAILAF